MPVTRACGAGARAVCARGGGVAERGRLVVSRRGFFSGVRRKGGSRFQDQGVGRVGGTNGPPLPYTPGRLGLGQKGHSIGGFACPNPFWDRCPTHGISDLSAGRRKRHLLMISTPPLIPIRGVRSPRSIALLKVRLVVSLPSSP